MTQKVMIGGYAGAGKSTLCLLLDGHPQLRVTTNERFDRVLSTGIGKIREKSALNTSRLHQLKAMFKLQMPDGIHDVHFATFRHLLDTYSFLNLIEAEALVGEKDSRTSNKAVYGLGLDLDFERFQSLWKEHLFGSNEVFTREQVLDTLYDCYFAAFRDADLSVQEDSIVVFCTEYGLAPVELALEDDFDAKYIALRRPREDFYVGLVERMSQRGDCETLLEAEEKSKQQFSRHLNKHVDHTIDDLARRYPDRFLILDIADVVMDYQKTMPRLAQFLGIKMDDILLRPTFHGRDMPRVEEYIGKINDAARGDVVTPTTRAVFELQYREASIWEALQSGNIRAGLEYSRLRLKQSRWGHRLPL
jgi:hypothetical protein